MLLAFTVIMPALLVAIVTLALSLAGGGLLWGLSGLLILMFVLEVNDVTSTALIPLAAIYLGLSVWSLRRQLRREP